MKCFFTNAEKTFGLSLCSDFCRNLFGRHLICRILQDKCKIQHLITAGIILTEQVKRRRIPVINLSFKCFISLKQKNIFLIFSRILIYLLLIMLFSIITFTLILILITITISSIYLSSKTKKKKI